MGKFEIFERFCCKGQVFWLDLVRFGKIEGFGSQEFVFENVFEKF